ncbi:DNA-processing protein DprA [Candidatus Avelusimicrobium gallicola]|uniref:DNA protecting protein DprA n=1 Tax=Candidatus Avelusimicrobium gallicola TaxID=2562704 RepID=A0A1Y4DAK6_9BACT|nr:DNA-processing protein DprA [Elusimicrobium sp. An273]OUO56243.1 DNA protecting protein DprA [Elusimicrobium sp. An273]
MNASISAAERLARIQLNAFLYFRADWLERLIEIFGSAQEILRQDAQTLAREANLNPSTAAHLLRDAFSIHPQEEWDKTAALGGHIYIPEDEEYPQSLRNIKEAPIALYVLGRLPAPEQACTALVGTRKITPYGRRVAAKLAGDLSACGVTVVSGLARGVDSECHAAAVRLQKPTVGVIGTGVGRCYPPENRALEKAILQHGGAIVSELPFNSPPNAFHFPRRNRIIAALSQPVVVIEGEIKSGALITAKLALEMGKDVLAVPGPIDSPQSAGPNALIRDGAGVVTAVSDILDYIPQQLRFGLDARFFEKKDDSAPKPQEELTPRQREVMNAVGGSQASLDQIAEALGADVPETASLLFELEVKGFLACENGLYSKSKF